MDPLDEIINQHSRARELEELTRRADEALAKDREALRAATAKRATEETKRIFMPALDPKTAARIETGKRLVDAMQRRFPRISAEFQHRICESVLRAGGRPVHIPSAVTHAAEWRQNEDLYLVLLRDGEVRKVAPTCVYHVPVIPPPRSIGITGEPIQMIWTTEDYAVRARLADPAGHNYYSSSVPPMIHILGPV